MLEIQVSCAFLRYFIEFALWKVSADSPTIWSQGFGPFAEMVLEHFTGLK